MHLMNVIYVSDMKRSVAFYESLGLAADRIGDYPQYPGFSLDLREAS